MNKREQAAFNAVIRSASRLAEIRHDMEVRELLPAFRVARALYERGYRVEGWGLVLTDTSNETKFWNVSGDALTKEIVWRSGKIGTVSVEYYADGTDRRTEHIPEYLALHEPDLGMDEDEMYDVLDYLDNLTVEGAE